MSTFKSIFFKGILWKALFYCTSFLLNVLLANYLGASESGVFFYLLNNLSIIIYFLCFGVDSAINYFNSRQEIAYKKLFNIALGWSFVTTLLFLALSPLFQKLGLLPGIVKLEYVVLFVLGAFLTSHLTALFLSSNDNVTPNLVSGVLNIALIFIIASQFNSVNRISDHSFVFKLYLLASFITGLLLLAFVVKNLYKKKHLTSLSFDRRKLINYSFSVFLANVFITLLMRSDVWLIKYLCTDSDLGNYIQTAKFLQLVLIVPMLASFSLFPLIAQNIGANNNIESKILKLVTAYIYLSVASCLFIVVIGRGLFPLLYGPSFSKMYFTFICFIPGAVALAASYPLTPYFSGKNMNKVITTNSLIAIIIMFVLDFALVPKYSIYGAAIGSSTAYLFYFLRLLYVFNKQYRFSINQVFYPDNFYTELVTMFKSRSGR